MTQNGPGKVRWIWEAQAPCRIHADSEHRFWRDRSCCTSWPHGNRSRLVRGAGQWEGGMACPRCGTCLSSRFAITGDHKGLLSLASVTDTWPKVLCAMTNMSNGSLAVKQWEPGFHCMKRAYTGQCILFHQKNVIFLYFKKIHKGQIILGKYLQMIIRGYWVEYICKWLHLIIEWERGE